MRTSEYEVRELKHIDAIGQEIKVGDYIMYAALWDRSATMKIGRVTELAFREEERHYDSDEQVAFMAKTPTLRVISADRWFSKKWTLQKDGKPIALGFVDRCTVIQRQDVDIFDLLDKTYLAHINKKFKETK